MHTWPSEQSGRSAISDTPIVAQKAPFAVEVKAGKTYFWCACGRSQKQPFCDGSGSFCDTHLTHKKCR